MARSKLLEHDETLAAERAADHAADAEREFKAAVRAAIPKSVLEAAKVAKRPRGRTAVGGISRREVASMRKKATAQLAGPEGHRDLEREVQLTAVTILKIDGLLGTEPWRAQGGHGPLIAMQARLRYLENATRILEDLRRSLEGTEQKLLEGVIDAEPGDATS